MGFSEELFFAPAGRLVALLKAREISAAEITQQFFKGFALPAESMPARCAIGSAQDCIEKIRSYVDAGCSKFVLWPIVPPEELVSQIETYGQKVVPQFS